MSQAVSRWPACLLTTEAHLRTQASLCVICGGQSENWTNPSVIPCQCHSNDGSYSSSIYTLILLEGQAGESWEPSKKRCSFVDRITMDIKIGILFFGGGGAVLVSASGHSFELCSGVVQVF